MPKKKNKKSKAQKRFEKQRKELRIVFSGYDEKAVCDDFCEIVETILAGFIESGKFLPENLSACSTICSYCVLGWNASVAHDSLKEALQYINRISTKFNDDTGLASVILQTVVEMKEEYCPEHHVLIDDATVLMEDGQPIIDVKLDMEAYHKKMEDMATGIPHMSEIIDHDALEKALEGIPEDKIEEAMNAAIKSQIEDYNNTPQEDLEGLSPSEAFQCRKK